MSRTFDEMGAQRAANNPSAANPFLTVADLSSGSIGLDTIYPVGSIIFRDSDSNPNFNYPGTTWVEFGAGCVLMSRNGTYARGSTFGEMTHTLTEAEMPFHGHSVNPPSTASSGASASHTHSGTTASNNADHTHQATTSANGAHSHTFAKDVFYNASGGGQVVPAGSGVAHSGGNLTSTASSHTHTLTTGTQSANHHHTFTSGYNSNDHTHTVNIGSFDSGYAGSGGAHNNAQPTIVVVVWKRTA
jgi:microcystin-dependent protein